MDKTETKISTEKTVKAHIFDLEIDTVRLPDGKTAPRDVIRHPGACCVVPLTDEGEIVCVRQFRYPFLTETLEIPAGKLDRTDGETPLSCAERELKEETGAKAGEMIFLGEYWSSPAILDERIYMYLARGLEFGEMSPDEDEFIDTVRYPLDTLLSMILDGKVPDGKTQAAVMKAALLLAGEKQT